MGGLGDASVICEKVPGGGGGRNQVQPDREDAALLSEVWAQSVEGPLSLGVTGAPRQGCG